MRDQAKEKEKLKKNIYIQHFYSSLGKWTKKYKYTQRNFQKVFNKLKTKKNKMKKKTKKIDIIKE